MFVIIRLKLISIVAFLQIMSLETRSSHKIETLIVIRTGPKLRYFFGNRFFWIYLTRTSFLKSPHNSTKCKIFGTWLGCFEKKILHSLCTYFTLWWWPIFEIANVDYSLLNEDDSLKFTLELRACDVFN